MEINILYIKFLSGSMLEISFMRIKCCAHYQESDSEEKMGYDSTSELQGQRGFKVTTQL